jgi:G3E family GTPase
MVDPADGDHAHHAFESWSFASTVPLDLERFRSAVRSLPATVIRGKGHVLTAADGTVTPMLFQLVGTRVEIAPWRGDHGAAGTELVLIAPPGALDKGELQARFEACRS